eukprot:354169-Chlamydomonas_euryale.AAC.21
MHGAQHNISAHQSSQGETEHCSLGTPGWSEAGKSKCQPCGCTSGQHYDGAASRTYWRLGMQAAPARMPCSRQTTQLPHPHSCMLQPPTPAPCNLSWTSAPDDTSTAGRPCRSAETCQDR